mgnify:CR=1 FL=1
MNLTLHRRCKAFTLVEVMIALLVCAILMAAFSTVLIYSQRGEANSSAVSRLEIDVHEAVRRVADELRQAGTAGPDWNFSAAAISYNDCTGASGGTATWGDIRSLALTASPGEILADAVDNNGNGLIDEAVLVLNVDGVPEILFTDIASNGLVFTQSGNDITVAITLRRLNQDGSPITASASTTVSLRN